MTPSKSTGLKPVEAIKHGDKRLNIPPAEAAELVDQEKARTTSLRWRRDPSLDPQFVWRGKDETDAEDLIVDAPPIYIQEKIDPRVLVDNLRRATEQTLFNTEEFDGLSGWDSVEYYQHGANWSNRMILGDSLQVMGSLAEKEDLHGKIQMIYFDPPYGIKFGSNWQVSTRRNKVSDGKIEDTTREVEQIKAFRDTWELGIHSYLSYLRDRLTVAHDLLTESGSIFVQIGDENVHLVRGLLDEVFGADNFVSLITFKTTSGAGSFAGGTNVLAAVNSYLVWYAKNLPNIKYRQIFRTKEAGGQGGGQYTWVERPDGSRARLSGASPEAEDRLLRPDQLTSQTTRVGQTTVFPVKIGGRTYLPNTGGWKTNRAGMLRLAYARRLLPVGNTLTYVRYLDDFPAFPYNNLWDDTVTSGFADPKIYVVQTNTKVVERCMLMTTDPGDLVLDPTCGSGTTAYVAEQWGRRWITIDTSRVALTLARQRVMGSQYPSYFLVDSPEGRKKEQELTGKAEHNGNATTRDVRKGFVYRRIPHITLKSIANNVDLKEGMSREEINAAISRSAEFELLYDKPYEDKGKVRVAGRFTVESLSPHRNIATGNRSSSEKAGDASIDNPSFEQTIIDNLRSSGVQNGLKRERLLFASLESHGGRYIQAFGEPKEGEKAGPDRIAVSIGPQYGTVNAEWVKEAAREALRGNGAQILLVCAFAFDPQAVPAAKEFAPSDPNDFASVAAERKLGKLPILFVRMNSDLVMGDVLLKKSKNANLFMVFGEPDIEIKKIQGNEFVVEIRGMDVYNPSTGEVKPSGTEDIALWMIDTDYTGDAFFVRHCYFTGGQDPYRKLKHSLRAEIDAGTWASLCSTRSRPFPTPESGKIAVKVINDFGDEVIQVYEV